LFEDGEDELQLRVTVIEFKKPNLGIRSVALDGWKQQINNLCEVTSTALLCDVETVKRIYFSETKEFYRIHLATHLMQEDDLFSYTAKHSLEET
jgi:hypothetical protein